MSSSSGRNEARFARTFEARFARTIARIAANDPSLTRVEFNRWGIGDAGAGRLIAALRTNTVITELRLEGNRLSAALVRALLVALENRRTSLTCLDLGGNSIGREGGKALTEFLRGNNNSSSLTDLYLDKCAIGVRVLAEALPGNSTLIRLGLGENSIGDAGARVLAGLLPGNSALAFLDLDENRISDAGAIALAEALPSNTSLATLNLGGNNISDASARLLVKALLVNSSLARIGLLGLWRNGIRNDISEALAQLVDELCRINADATNPQEALEVKIEWLRTSDEGRLRLLGFEESGVEEEEVLRLEVVCRVGWLINSGVDGEKEEAVTLVLDRLEHFMQAGQRRSLFTQLLGLPDRGMEVAASVDATRGRALYWYAVDCGAKPGMLLTIIRAHPSLCTCKDVWHRLYPFMLLATMEEARAEDVMELLLLNPNLVEDGIPDEH